MAIDKYWHKNRLGNNLIIPSRSIEQKAQKLSSAGEKISAWCPDEAGDASNQPACTEYASLLRLPCSISCGGFARRRTAMSKWTNLVRGTSVTSLHRRVAAPKEGASGDNRAWHWHFCRGCRYDIGKLTSRTHGRTCANCGPNPL